MDWATASIELAKNLSAHNVKERQQAGRKLSYIEGWLAIAEANRIFGFDGWTRETVEIKCVAERERKIGQQQKDGWSVSYTARVRVTVGGVIREGVGAGHGIDVDLGLAHESAIKESETDAMKRALTTFGNPFGLALYDKTQAHVEDDRPDHPPPRREPAPAPGSAAAPVIPLLPEDRTGAFIALDAELRTCIEMIHLHEWDKKVVASKDAGALTDNAIAHLRRMREARRQFIMNPPPGLLEQAPKRSAA